MKVFADVSSVGSEIGGWDSEVTGCEMVGCREMAPEEDAGSLTPDVTRPLAITICRLEIATIMLCSLD
jgi:hypothetical protein